MVTQTRTLYPRVRESRVVPAGRTDVVSEHVFQPASAKTKDGLVYCVLETQPHFAAEMRCPNGPDLISREARGRKHLKQRWTRKHSMMREIHITGVGGRQVGRVRHTAEKETIGPESRSCRAQPFQQQIAGGDMLQEIHTKHTLKLGS